ncbi:MAG: DUF2007 domain-containing protein, partial [Pseudomonadota bacterium]
MALRTLYAGLEIERALVVRSLLLAHDIPCYLHNEYHSAIDPTLQLALGGTPISVPESCLETAREIIDATTHEDSWPSDWPDEDDPHWTCTQCGCKKHRKQMKRSASAIGLTHFIASGMQAPFAPRRTISFCENCGNKQKNGYHSGKKYWCYYIVSILLLVY